MLDPWVIEEILERERQQREEQPVVELPVVPEPECESNSPMPETSERPTKRGIEIVELW
jgi:hypothetical protein